MVTAPLRPARLAVADVLRLAASGLRARPLRAFLSALGIAIGVAAMIAVIGVSVSSRADLNRTLDKLGTNLLRVAPADDLSGNATRLPTRSAAMISRIEPVEAVAGTGVLPTGVYRNEFIPSGRTSSVAVLASPPELLTAVGGSVHTGSWFTAATGRYPAVVLGADAANRLDVHTPGTRLWLGKRWFSLVGVLDPVALVPELDAAAFVPWGVAVSYLHFDGHPNTVYVRADEAQVVDVATVLPRTAKPEDPAEVQVSRPSDALTAREAANATLTSLLLGLGGVALLVGSIGVGNIMIISVLERRSEIGLRRCLGATRGQIRRQFMAESLLLSALGGTGGALLGTLITAIFCANRGWPVVIPVWATPAGLLLTVVIGALAGVYPALRASRLPPTEALNQL